MALAVTARIGDHGPSAPATGTGLLDGEEALLHAHLPGAVAGRAGVGLGPRLGAGTTAELALHRGRDSDLDLFARYGLLQAQAQVVTQIRASMGPSASRPAAKDIAEDIAEDIGEATGPTKITRATKSATGIDAGVAELIERGALLGITQDLVGEFDLFELPLALLARISVRVVLHGEPPIGLLDVGLAGVAGNPQYVVIVAFGHVIGS